MEELVQRYLSQHISRRDFVGQLTALGFTVAASQSLLAQLDPNTPMGQGKGVIPGRVTWVRDPAALSWNGPMTVPAMGRWWIEGQVSQTVIDKMVSRNLQALTDQRSDRQAWDAIFRSFNQTHGFGKAGYQRGEKIAIKLNANQDMSAEWGVISKEALDLYQQQLEQAAKTGGRAPQVPGAVSPLVPGGPPMHAGNGLHTPEVVASLVTQLVRVAGVPSGDIVIYDAANGRTIGDPIFGRFKGDKAPADLRGVTFVTNTDYGLTGRVPVIVDEKTSVRFSGAKKPLSAYLPLQVTATKYLINLCSPHPHGLAGLTAQGKNHFGSIYFPNNGGWTPAPAHSFVSSRNPMGSYNALVDLTGHRHLGGKTVLFMADAMFTTDWQNGDVMRLESLGDAWLSSILMSQDPIALDSVALDILKAEPRATRLQGTPDNYLHEAALADKPPSGTVYDPDGTGKPLASLGAHEHWNNPKDKKYSRNLGKKDGIELIAELG